MFDLDKLDKIPFLKSVEWFAELPSTNDLAKELAKTDTKLPALILAEQQTAGRGRGSNRWLSQGNQLTFSMLIAPSQFDLSINEVPTISITTALALCQAIKSTTGIEALIKWPNDVYLQDKKLAGILLESPVQDRLVIGVGVNLDWAPTDDDDLRMNGIALSEDADENLSANALLIAFIEKFESLLCNLKADSKQIATDWNESSYLTCKTITVESDNNLVTGLCGGLGIHGELLVKAGSEFLAFTTGTVVSIESAKT